MVAYHEHSAGVLVGVGPSVAAEERRDDAGRVAPPVRSRELVEDLAQAAAVKPECGRLRCRGPRDGAGVPRLVRFPGRPPVAPHPGVRAGLDLDGGARWRRR
jgi:hypothetical protein